MSVLSWDLGFLAEFSERCYGNVLELPLWLFDSSKRFFWIYLLSFAILGWISYRLYARDPAAKGFSGFVAFLLPWRVYSHPSAILDYKLFLTNRMLTPAALLSGIVFSSLTTATFANEIEDFLQRLFTREEPPLAWSWPVVLGFTLCSALVSDFSTYFTHALHHRVPVLWAFHKVHHSAEVLTPITLYRKHPIYTLFSKGMDMIIIGPFLGLVAFLFAGDADAITLFGSNMVFALFNLIGGNLRHSHIWLPYGFLLSHVFISPAQHQIHHSQASQHWNKNYGEVFALWDWIFGTLYVPREKENLTFGLAGEAAQPHGTLWRAYFVPFLEIGQMVRRYLARWPRAVGRIV